MVAHGRCVGRPGSSSATHAEIRVACGLVFAHHQATKPASPKAGAPSSVYSAAAARRNGAETLRRCCAASRTSTA